MPVNDDLQRFAGRLARLLDTLNERWRMTPDFDRQDVLEHLEDDLRRLHADMRAAVYGCDMPECTDPTHTPPAYRL